MQQGQDVCDMVPHKYVYTSASGNTPVCKVGILQSDTCEAQTLNDDMLEATDKDGYIEEV